MRVGSEEGMHQHLYYANRPPKWRKPGLCSLSLKPASGRGSREYKAFCLSLQRSTQALFTMNSGWKGPRMQNGHLEGTGDAVSHPAVLMTSALGTQYRGY